jgi:D-glycero-D-manno-heptose 1,7-bisphosphate phosphatase
MRRVPALFLDRDGVINVDHGYVHRVDQFEFLPGIFDLCRAAHARDHRVVVVTNQAGIGRGLYTEREFLELTEWMRARFRDEGAPIDRVYFCPTHPTAGIGAYRVRSAFRKPEPGMILQAASELGVDLAASVLVGDKASDAMAGVAAGVGRIVVLGDTDAGDSADLPPGCHRVRDLAAAVAHLGWGS